MKATEAEIVKVIATNRKATHDFRIHERMEAGIQLVGSEVKSLRDARVVIGDGFVQFHKGQAFLHNVQIQEYSQANRWGHELARVRKLLLHRHEIDKLIGRVERDGYTLIPTALYWKANKVKLELALAKGKQDHDKRATEKERDWNREKQRVMRRGNPNA